MLSLTTQLVDLCQQRLNFALNCDWELAKLWINPSTEQPELGLDVFCVSVNPSTDNDGNLNLNLEQFAGNCFLQLNDFNSEFKLLPRRSKIDAK